jgi:hypothetical protein
MRQALFSPEGWAETLYVPPLHSWLMLRTALMWERVGVTLSLPFAGVHIVEATKQLYRPVAVRAARRATRLAPVLVPSPAACTGLRNAPLEQDQFR